MKKAFTLIELLVVISIIGILIGLSVFGLQGARVASRDAVRTGDLGKIASGLGFYKTDCDTYPLTNLFPVGNGATQLTGSGIGSSCLITNIYLSTIPADPGTTSKYSYTSSDGLTFYLCAALERTPNPTPDPSGPIQNCGSCGASSCNYYITNP